jgi:methylphosphotriester-DNA--protein-cysteine methyltransferase
VYQLRAPHPDLAPYIEHYWFVTAEDGPVDIQVQVFVDVRADLVFTYGAGYTRQVIGGAATAHAASNLDAQRVVPIRIQQRGLVHLVGVRFRLGGLGPFVQHDLRRFTNHTPPPGEVFGADALALEQELRALNAEEAARRLDAFLVAHLRIDPRRPAFEAALAVLVASGGTTTVEEAARRAGVSARQVDRLFARELGLAPKTVARVLRFQTALRALMRDPAVSLADASANAGYFDQPHFVREFRRLSGGVPRGYRGYYPPDGPSDFAPNVVAFVQDRPGRAARS